MKRHNTVCLAQIVMLEQRGDTAKYVETGLNFSQHTFNIDLHISHLSLAHDFHMQNGIILHCMLHKIYLLGEKYMTCLESVYKFYLPNVKCFCLCRQSGTFTHESGW